jgi:hypothetical protein
MSCDKKERVDLAPSLKTFPSPKQSDVERCPLYWYHKRTEWKRDFEASLRSRFFHYCDECYKPHSCVTGCKVKFSVDALKEILGVARAAEEKEKEPQK